MAGGVMVSMAQFGLYVAAASQGDVSSGSGCCCSASSLPSTRSARSSDSSSTGSARSSGKEGRAMATATTHASAEFAVERSKRSLGYNLPQQLGRRLWLPMFLMALMAFPVGVVLGIIRGDEISTGGGAEATEVHTLKMPHTAKLFIA